MKKRNYFILRRGEPWSICNRETRTHVYDYPAYFYDQDIIDKICFSKSDDEVKKHAKVALTKFEETIVNECYSYSNTR